MLSMDGYLLADLQGLQCGAGFGGTDSPSGYKFEWPYKLAPSQLFVVGSLNQALASIYQKIHNRCALTNLTQQTMLDI